MTEKENLPSQLLVDFVAVLIGLPLLVIGFFLVASFNLTLDALDFTVGVLFDRPDYCQFARTMPLLTT